MTKEEIREKNKLRMRAWRASNPDRDKSNDRKFREKNREKINSNARERRSKDPETYNERIREWRKKNVSKCTEAHNKWLKKKLSEDPEYLSRYRKTPQQVIRRNAHDKERLSYDPSYKALRNIRRRIHTAICRAKTNKKLDTMSLLGCDIKSFMIYIESKFQEGMSWENYGVDTWHLDHIKPCSLFQLEDKEDQKKCFHFSNYQPLWAADNLAKSNTYLTSSQDEL